MESVIVILAVLVVIAVICGDDRGGGGDAPSGRTREELDEETAWIARTFDP